MLLATDTFIEYLAENLGGIPVHWRHQTPNDENADSFKQGALNVKVLGYFQDGSLEYALVSLDLLGSDERTVLGQLTAVRDLLIQEQVTPEYDYANPDNPFPTGLAVSWDGDTVRFLNVRTPQGTRYVHFNATFPLTHARE